MPFAVLAFALALATLAGSIAPAWSQERMTTLLRERLKTRPEDPTLHYYLALSEIAEGNKAGGIAALKEVSRLGKGFLPPRGFGFEPAWEDSAFQSVRAELERKLPKVIAARELFRLDRALIPEGIAYDPQRRSYFVGSVATGRIVRVDSSGAVSDLSRPGELHQVLGLAVDAGRRRLHAVSTSGVATAAGQKAVNEVVSYHLDAGTRVRVVAVPAAVQLNDVTVSAAGDLYATDTRAGAVFRIADAGGSGGAVVDTLVAPGTLPGANGLALSPDGSVLFVAHSTGVARIELAGRALSGRIDLPAGEAVSGIDGLYADGSTLIGIQNVTNPGRVIRIHLRPDGRGAERIETLLSHHHPAIDEPTTGVIVGRTFALLATTQVARFTPAGTIESPETLKPPVVLSIEL